MNGIMTFIYLLVVKKSLNKEFRRSFKHNLLQNYCEEKKVNRQKVNRKIIKIYQVRSSSYFKGSDMESKEMQKEMLVRFTLNTE